MLEISSADGNRSDWISVVIRREKDQEVCVFGLRQRDVSLRRILGAADALLPPSDGDETKSVLVFNSNIVVNSDEQLLALFATHAAFFKDTPIQFGLNNNAESAGGIPIAASITTAALAAPVHFETTPVAVVETAPAATIPKKENEEDSDAAIESLLEELGAALADETSSGGEDAIKSMKDPRRRALRDLGHSILLLLKKHGELHTIIKTHKHQTRMLAKKQHKQRKQQQQQQEGEEPLVESSTENDKKEQVLASVIGVGELPPPAVKAMRRLELLFEALPEDDGEHPAVAAPLRRLLQSSLTTLKTWAQRTPCAELVKAGKKWEKKYLKFHLKEEKKKAKKDEKNKGNDDDAVVGDPLDGLDKAVSDLLVLLEQSEDAATTPINAEQGNDAPGVNDAVKSMMNATRIATRKLDNADDLLLAARKIKRGVMSMMNRKANTKKMEKKEKKKEKKMEKREKKGALVLAETDSDGDAVVVMTTTTDDEDSSKKKKKEKKRKDKKEKKDDADSSDGKESKKREKLSKEDVSVEEIRKRIGDLRLKMAVLRETSSSSAAPPPYVE